MVSTENVTTKFIIKKNILYIRPKTLIRQKRSSTKKTQQTHTPINTCTYTATNTNTHQYNKTHIIQT